MIEKSKEDIDEERALNEFSLFMVRNWDTLRGRWFAEKDLQDAISANDEPKIAELNEEVSQVKVEAIRLEEAVYLTKIEACKAAKILIAKSVASNSHEATPQQIAQLTQQMTSTIDKELWRAEQQLENHRKKQR